MNPWQRGKKLAAGFLLALFLIVLALGSGTFLGELYIKMFISKEELIKTASEVKVMGQDKADFSLPPLPLYTSQVGGIDLNEKDASYLTAKLQELGYSPYRTLSHPQKVLVGTFSKRNQAENLTKLLTEEGFGARVTTLLLNDKDNSEYNKEVKPLLLGYTQWLQETTLLWEVYNEIELNQEIFLEALPLSYEAYEKIKGVPKNPAFKQEPLKSSVASLKSASAQYMLALQILSKEWTAENYGLAQQALLEVIDNYQILASQGLQEKKV